MNFTGKTKHFLIFMLLALFLFKKIFGIFEINNDLCVICILWLLMIFIQIQSKIQYGRDIINESI